MDDTESVAALLDELAAAWNAGDADAYGDCFTEDATYIVYNGMLLSGPREIAEAHRHLFAGPLQGSSLGGVEAAAPAIRLVAPGVAHVMVTGGVRLAGQEAPDPARDSRITYLAVRRGQAWRFAALEHPPHGGGSGGGPRRGVTPGGPGRGRRAGPPVRFRRRLRPSCARGRARCCRACWGCGRRPGRSGEPAGRRR
ncbi:SgcJ/EcaC family oxidoreductase [Streptomonospora arabica]|uniref:SgcJ/EcaC family oxidoreductase n=1 Tax=Streptomonospora arabica TaxID=412417 RepID=A0ABV9SN90_9ACTN